MISDIDPQEVLDAVSDDLRFRLMDAAVYAAGVVAQEAPVRIGKLKAGIYPVVDQNELRFRVVVPAFYASFAEFADQYRPGVKQRHNPFLQRGVLRAGPGVLDIMQGK